MLARVLLDQDVTISREVLRRGGRVPTRGPSGGREGAPDAKAPYVDSGFFSTDWGISKQPSAGEEDIANLNEDDWRATSERPHIARQTLDPRSWGSWLLLPVASVREWELLGLASLEEEDKLEEARHLQRKSTGDKIADPEWRPWREPTPQLKKRKGRRKRAPAAPEAAGEAAPEAVAETEEEAAAESEPVPAETVRPSAIPQDTDYASSGRCCCQDQGEEHELSAAATRIQARHRGRKGRSAAAERRQDRADQAPVNVADRFDSIQPTGALLRFA